MVYRIHPKAKIFNTAKIVRQHHSIIVEADCTIGDFAFIAARNFWMMYGSQVGMHAVIGGGGDVVLKRFSVVGSNATLIPATESPKAEYMCEAGPPDGRKVIRGSICIGEKAYIGAGATICVSEDDPDIEIGDRVIIGAGSYIDKSIPNDRMVYPKQTLVNIPREIWLKETR